MTIEKLKSGSYRIRQAYDGIRYSVTVPYKPTKKECLQLMAAEMDKAVVSKQRMTFETAANKYIETKENILSPATISGYKSILKNLSSKFLALYINDITNINVQKEINAYSKTRSPKTVRNANGFISAVLGLYCPNTVLNTTLPQKVKKEPYIPTDADVEAILKYAKGTEYELPLILATFGMRRSEICALTINDIEGNIIHINKALVPNKNFEFVIKTTKTTDSTRDIYIPDNVVQLITSKGYIYKGHPNNILRYLNKVQDKLGIHRFSFHKLRHYYASMSHALGIPDSYIMVAGGWKSDAVLKSVYRHTIKDKKQEMQEFAAQYINELIE